MKSLFYFIAIICAGTYLINEYPVVAAHIADTATDLMVSRPVGKPCPESNPLGLNRRGEHIKCTMVRTAPLYLTPPKRLQDTRAALKPCPVGNGEGYEWVRNASGRYARCIPS